MPNLWRKKNKSYGVSGKDSQGSVGGVRPLSAAFGTTELRHLDEDEAASKKAKVRDRGVSKSAKSSSNSRSRSTSVPPRPKSGAFGSHILPQSHIAKAKPPKRSESPVSYSKPRARLDPFLHADQTKEPEAVKGRNGRKISNSGSFGDSGKLTVIRYTDKSMTQSADLWKSPVTHETEHKDFDPYQTVYQVLNPVKDRSESIESLPESPFPREPSFRVATNSYHAKKSFSTFAAEDGDGANNGHSSFSPKTEHIYDEPTDLVNPRHNSLKKSHLYDEPANIQNVENDRRVPPPPKRSTSLHFEEVSIPTEQYRPLNSFIAPLHRKLSSSDQFEASEPQIVHTTHESTKSPGVGEYDSLTMPVLSVHNSSNLNHDLTKQTEYTDNNSSFSGSEGKESNSNISDSAKLVPRSAYQYSDSVLHSTSAKTGIKLNALECDTSDTSSSHLQYEMSDMDMLSLKSERTPRRDTIHEISANDTKDSVLSLSVQLQEQSSSTNGSLSETCDNYQLNDSESSFSSAVDVSDIKVKCNVISGGVIQNSTSVTGKETCGETSSESSWSDAGSSTLQGKTESDRECSIKDNKTLVSGSSGPHLLQHDLSAENSLQTFARHTDNKDETTSQISVGNTQATHTKFKGNTQATHTTENYDASEETQNNTVTESQFTINRATIVDSVNVQNTDTDLMSLTNTIEEGSVTDANTDRESSVNNDFDATRVGKLIRTDKENVPPKAEHKGVHVLAIIHSLNTKKDNNREDRVIKTDLPEPNVKSIDYISRNLSGSENVLDVTERDRKVGAANGGLISMDNSSHVNLQKKQTCQEYIKTQEASNGTDVISKALSVTSMTKPVVPYKPKKLCEKQEEEKQLTSSGNALNSSTGNERTLSGLLAPKPFLSKPQKFVPSKIITGSALELTSDTETSEKVGSLDSKAPSVAPIIKPFKSVPFSSMLQLSKKEQSLSNKDSVEVCGKDSIKANTRPKPTLAVKPQFAYKPSNSQKTKEGTVLRSLTTIPSKPVVPIRSKQPSYMDTNSAAEQLQVDTVNISEVDTTTHSESASIQNVSLKQNKCETVSSPVTVSEQVHSSMNSVSFLDSLKGKHMVKREPSYRHPVIVKDDAVTERNDSDIFKRNETKEECDITSVKETATITSQNKVDVTSFLDDLKTCKKRGIVLSPRIGSPGSVSLETSLEEDIVKSSQLTPEKKSQKPLADLAIEPILLDKSEISATQNKTNHQENTFEPKSESGNKRLSIKEMLINDLPETSVDTDHEWDESLEQDNSGTFSGLRTIDTMSNREHATAGVLSPRQLKRSKGKFSRGSFTDQKPVSVVKRRRRLSSSSCSEKGSISDSYPNDDISKTSNNVSIQSQNSAFHVVKSDDEADTSLDMVADIPEEFQVKEATQISPNDAIMTWDDKTNNTNKVLHLDDVTIQVPVQFEIKETISSVTLTEKANKPTPPPRKNKGRRYTDQTSGGNLRSSLSNSDKSSSKQSSAVSSELAEIEQSQQTRFIPLGSEGYFDGNFFRNEDDVSEQGLCMPWDNAPWDAAEEDSFVIAPSEFRSDDIVPSDISLQIDIAGSDHEAEHVNSDSFNHVDYIDVNRDIVEEFDDKPSPQNIPSPEVQDINSDAETESSSHTDTKSDTNNARHLQDSDLIIPMLNLEDCGASDTDMQEYFMQDSALVVPKLNLEGCNAEDEPPSPFEADEAVSKIFDDTVRQSARHTSRTDVATSPRSIPSSQETSQKVSVFKTADVTPVDSYVAKKAYDTDDILEKNDRFTFERNMKGLRSPVAAVKRRQDTLIVESDHSSSSSSKYSERAIDIQDLDTDGKPMTINRHNEERAVDIDGLERSSIIRSPLTPAQRRRRKENRLSDSGSSQQSKQLSHTKANKPLKYQTSVPNLNLKDTTDSEASSYSHNKVNDNRKNSEPQIFVYNNETVTDTTSLKDAASPRESLSPTTPSSVCVSEISDIKPNPRDLDDINLPGLKLNQEVTGPLRGSEHLHPALERSLRTNMTPQRMTANVGGSQPSGSEAGLAGLGSELMILVEEDYMTPRPGYNHAVMQNREMPEPWTFDMMHNVRQPMPTSAPLGGLLHRQDSMLSQVSSTTTITNNRWKTQPVELWENEDVVDWAEAVGFEELADALHGTGLGGNQLLQFQEKTLVDLGLINTELRSCIIEEVNKLKEQPKSAVPLWTLKQASVRRKNLEASSNAIKSRLTNLQQLNTKQEEQIQSYIQELKDHQKQNELLINSPPPSVDGLSDSTLDINQYTKGRDRLARLSSVSTEVSAFLPPLSLTESEVSAYNNNNKVPIKPLVDWDNSEVLQWLVASGLYMFSHLFFTHKVSGRDLSEISMQFLDKIGIEKLEERELLLSKLYELQHPGEPSLEEVLRGHSEVGSKTIDTTSSSVPNTQGSLKSAGSSTSSSAVSLTRDSRKRSSVVMGTRMVSKELTRESPWTPASNRKSRDLSTEERETAESNVMIWHQLGGTMTSSYIRVQEATSCYDVIQNLLQLQHVTDDSNLFYVVDRDFSGKEVELGKFEDMSVLQRQWDNPVGHKLELRQRSGVQIKVFYKTTEGQQKTKGFRIATCSSYSEVLLVACKKFRVKRPGDFMLLELNRSTGGASQIAAAKNISELLSDSFILCEKSALSEALQMAALLKRRASCSSQNSSNLSDTASQVTVTSSHFEQVDGLQPEIVEFDTSLIADSDEDEDFEFGVDSNQIYPSTNKGYNRFHSKSSHNITQDDFAKSSKFTQLKPLHRNYRSMDDVDFLNPKNFYDTNGYDDNGIPPRRVLSANDELDRVHQHAPDSLELLQEIALLKESLRERDISLIDIRSENKELKAKTHDVVFTQNRLKNLESMYSDKQDQWKAEVSSLQQQLQQLQQQQLEADPKAKVIYLETKIEESRANVWRQEEDVMVVKEELEKQASDNRPDVGLVEYLQSQLNQSENLLLSLKQEHGDLLLQLEHTHKKVEKKTQETTVDLYALIGSDKPLCLHALELEPKNGSYGLMIGRDNEKRLMVRHTEEGRPIIKGDRLIEVNGRLVAKLEDDEIANFLKSAKEKNGALKIVVLREQDPIKGHVTKEENDQMKEDYSMAMMEVESLQLENKDLSAEVAMLTKDFDKAAKERDNLKKNMDQLKNQYGSLPLTDSDFAEASPHRRLQLMLDTINAGKPRNEAVTASQLRRGASRRGLDWFNTLVSVDRLDQVLAYDELDEKLPLYESMKIAPKEDVLQALKDTILETKQQKAYLDKLMALVIDHSPYLLKFVDTSMGMDDDLMSIKSRTEEKC